MRLSVTIQPIRETLTATANTIYRLALEIEITESIRRSAFSNRIYTHDEGYKYDTTESKYWVSHSKQHEQPYRPHHGNQVSSQTETGYLTILDLSGIRMFKVI